MKYLCKVCGLIQLMQYEKSLIITITKLIKFNYNKKTFLYGHLNQRLLGNNLSPFKCFQTAFRHLLATNSLHF